MLVQQLTSFNPSVTLLSRKKSYIGDTIFRKIN